LGRGPGSGKGKRAGRGQDGQGSRSGGGVRIGFEGGQMPLHRRIPKRGFKSRNRVEYQPVNVRDLARIEAGEVTPQVLEAHGLIRNLKKPVKILGMGEVESAYQVSAHAFSGAARTKIEEAGGSVTVLGMAPKAQGAPEIAAPEAADTEETPDPEAEEGSETEDEQA